MDQLVKEISSRVGITEDQAREAVNMVVGFVKQQLPAPIASQVDGFLGGSGASGGSGDIMGQAGDMLGGMFGGKK